MRTLKVLRKRKPTFIVAKWLVRFYGLSLLLANEVEVAFVEDVVSDMPDDERFRKCADYVVENYLDVRCDFPPTLWAETADLDRATTNGCKSYHAHLNAELYSAQPNIYLFVETLLRQQTSTYISLASLLVTASSQEQQREVCISVTHVHRLPRGTSVQKRVLAVCIIPI